jgi:hypothetical protein
MIAQLQKNWFRIKGGHPGRRFHDFYRQRQMARGSRLTFGKIATIGGGLLLIAAGIALVPLPGPGSAVGILGLALLGSEFEFVAHALDRLEARLRPSYEQFRKRWEKVPGSTRVGIEIVLSVLGIVIGYISYVLLFAKP